MSVINVWNTDQDGTSGDEGEVRLNNVDKNSEGHTCFETDSETIEAVRHILDLLDRIDNGDVIVITKDVW